MLRDLIFSRARRRAGVPPQGPPFEPSPSTPHQVGTSPLEVWYAGLANNAAFLSDAFGVNSPVGFPVVLGRSGIVDRLGFEVTGGGAAGSVARVGIYKATSKDNLYPSSLVVDGGEKTTTAPGVKSSTISVYLEAGLYWFVYICGVNFPNIRMIPAAALAPIMGMPAAFGSAPNNRIDATGLFNYGALPSTFPAGASLSNNFHAPLVAVRFAA